MHLNSYLGNHCSLLMLLYTLQGIPIGLSAAVPFLLQQKKVSRTEQAKFSIVAWPFALKLLWAPLAPGWPGSSAKQVAVRSLLFERHLHRLVDVDALALEAPRRQPLPTSSTQWLCDVPTLLLQRLSVFASMGAALDALAPRRFKCLIAGPSGAGKTSVLDALCGRPPHYASRFGGFHVETVVASGAGSASGSFAPPARQDALRETDR